MKRIFLVALSILLLVSCKKNEFSPEGPTDIRIRNISTLDFTEVVIKTSEYDEDVATISSIPAGGISEYQRFRKAYPKAGISAKIIIDDSPVTFTTGPADYTYLQYLSRQRVTFVVYISSMSARTLAIDEMIPEEELVLK